MDVEQLKMILDLVQETTRGALFIAFLYIAKPYFATGVWAGLLGLIARWGFKTILRSMELSGFMAELKGAAGFTGTLTATEKNRIIRWVTNGKEH
jgi:hypothetical protein